MHGVFDLIHTSNFQQMFFIGKDFPPVDLLADLAFASMATWHGWELQVRNMCQEVIIQLRLRGVDCALQTSV